MHGRNSSIAAVPAATFTDCTGKDGKDGKDGTPGTPGKPGEYYLPVDGLPLAYSAVL